MTEPDEVVLNEAELEAAVAAVEQEKEAARQDDPLLPPGAMISPEDSPGR